MINHFSRTFNPEKKIDEEKLDYNELKIISEYQVYNLIFCKKELLLDDEKTAYLLEIFYKLLGLTNKGEKIEGTRA